MDKSKKEQGKKCFIITPIGDSASDTFRMAKGVIESVIKPVLTQNGYDDIKPSYEINQSGMINTQIINRIIDDDLVIANLTGNNPNVMYELCLRHVTAKPIIHICQSGTTLPFDIKDNRTIFYENDMLGAHELMSQLELFVKDIDYTKECVDNPIYNAQRMGKLLKEVPADSENKVEIELLQNILEQIGALKMPLDREIVLGPAALVNSKTHKFYVIRMNEDDFSLYEKVEDSLDVELGKYNLIKIKRSGTYITYSNSGGIPDNIIRKIIERVADELKVVLEITGSAFYN